MTFRGLAIVLTLCGIAASVIALAEEPERVSVVVGKLGEGGMWTALAVFVGIAAVLGYRRRDAAGRRR